MLVPSCVAGPESPETQGNLGGGGPTWNGGADEAFTSVGGGGKPGGADNNWILLCREGEVMRSEASTPSKPGGD